MMTRPSFVRPFQLFGAPLVSLALLLAPLALSTGCNQERNESIRLMNKGIEYYKRNKPTEALDQLAEAAEVDPSNDRAIFYQGLIEYQRLGRYDQGEKNIRRAIELNADDYEYHYHLGALLLRKKEYAQAVHAFEKAIELEPDHAESHLRLGQALEGLGKYDRAQEEYAAAIRANPRLAEAYHALGGLYLRFEQYAHAAQVLKNGIENNPAYAGNYRELGLVYQAQNRFDDAVAQFERARSLDPGDATLLFNLGMTHASNDNAQKALQFLENYLVNRTAAEDPVRVRMAQEKIARLEQGADAPE